MRLSTDCGAFGFWASPESECTTFTSLPSTTPASFMSLTARSTAANSGGPRNASEPVCGSSVPTVKVPSPLTFGNSLTLQSSELFDDFSLALSDALLSDSSLSVPPEAPGARTAPNAIAVPTRNFLVGRHFDPTVLHLLNWNS